MSHSSKSAIDRKISIAPMLSVRNGAKTIEFYKAAFGASEQFRLDDEGGAVVPQLFVRAAEFGLTDGSLEHLNFRSESVGGGTVRMVSVLEGPDATFDPTVAAGGKIVWPVFRAHGTKY